MRLAERMGEDIVAFERQVTGHDLRPSGELRVTTNDTVLVLPDDQRVRGFRKAYPEIVLDVVVSNQALNLSKRDADVAVRATDRPPEALIGRRAASIAWAVFARDRRRRRRASIRQTDARDAEWIGFGDNLANLKAAKWLKEHAAAERIVYRINTVLGSGGGGRGRHRASRLLPCFIGAATPGLTRLTAPLARAGRRHLAAHPCGPAPDRARARLHGFRRERNRQAAQGDRGGGRDAGRPSP